MNLVIALPLILITGAITTSLSFWFLNKAHEHPPSDWAVVHVLSPVLRTISLIIAVSLVFPVLFPQSSVAALWQMLLQQEHFNNLLNSLFFASLLMSFIPLLSHPMVSLPSQSCLAIAVVFDWFFSERSVEILWMPDWLTILKLVVTMLAILLIGHQLASYVSKQVDETYHLTGSIQLVADVIYLPLLVPIMMIYGGWLSQQLPLTAVI